MKSRMTPNLKTSDMRVFDPSNIFDSSEARTVSEIFSTRFLAAFKVSSINFPSRNLTVPFESSSTNSDSCLKQLSKIHPITLLKTYVDFFVGQSHHHRRNLSELWTAPEYEEFLLNLNKSLK